MARRSCGNDDSLTKEIDLVNDVPNGRLFEEIVPSALLSEV